MATISPAFQSYLELWRTIIPESVGRLDPQWPFDTTVHEGIRDQLRECVAFMTGREARVARADIRWHQTLAIGWPEPGDARELLDGIRARTNLARQAQQDGALYLSGWHRYRTGITSTKINGLLLAGAALLAFGILSYFGSQSKSEGGGKS